MTGDVIDNETVYCNQSCVYIPSVDIKYSDYIVHVASVTKGNAGPMSVVNINKSKRFVLDVNWKCASG